MMLHALALTLPFPAGKVRRHLFLPPFLVPFLRACPCLFTQYLHLASSLPPSLPPSLLPSLFQGPGETLTIRTEDPFEGKYFTPL